MLPLPFVRPQLTRVTFATSVTPESLEQPANLGKESPGRHRAASTSSNKDSNILEEEGEIVKQSRSNSGVTIAQHLQSGDSSSHIIIGASDYDPSRSKVSREEWVSLERRAASGLQGVARENFRPSLLVMDHATDNSHTPFCVINGKQPHSQTLWRWSGSVTNNSSETVWSMLTTCVWREVLSYFLVC